VAQGFPGELRRIGCISMVKLPHFDPIFFLVARKFPSIGPFFAGDELAADTESSAEIKAYVEELQKLPASELQALVDAESAKITAEKFTRAEAEEQKRFWNLPGANADFDHWSRASYWTLDEAVALTLGKDPRVVSWDRIKSMTRVSKFASRYEELRDLATRAKWASQLWEPVLPTIFLGWAKRVAIPIMPELLAAIDARGLIVADWKTLYDNLKNSKDRVISELQATIENLRSMHANATEAFDKLRADYEQLATQRDKDIGVRQRDTLLKLVIGMAVGGYSFDPRANRSDKIPEIVDDLERAGVAVGDDTVRKYLRQAADFLPSLTDER